MGEEGRRGETSGGGHQHANSSQPIQLIRRAAYQLLMRLFPYHLYNQCKCEAEGPGISANVLETELGKDEWMPRNFWAVFYWH